VHYANTWSSIEYVNEVIVQSIFEAAGNFDFCAVSHYPQCVIWQGGIVHKCDFRGSFDLRIARLNEISNGPQSTDDDCQLG